MPTEQVLFEAPRREFKRDEEKRLKRRLVSLLRDDGKGHHHAKYAERLELLDVQIVPLKVDPKYTASISYDEGIVRIGEGFLNDPDTFYQLNVLIRHELAHNFLMHQVRMAYKLGEMAFVRTSFSRSLHRLHNILADDEISNRKYSEEDKIIVRNMVLNGREIGGLVTEDHRKDWIYLSIEEMYDRICEEIEAINDKLKRGLSKKDVATSIGADSIGQEILDTYIYTNINSGSIIKGTLKDFAAKDYSLGGKKLGGPLREIVKLIYESLDGVILTDEEVSGLLKKISTSSPIEVVDLFDDGVVELYTPEEKYIAVEMLKKYKSEYAEWFDKVIETLGEDFTEEELNELLGVLK
jgi:hypothetical protein